MEEKQSKNNLKMYILIKDDVPLGFAINSAAHAAVGCVEAFKDTPEVKEWMDPGPFYKVVCKVTPGEFEGAKKTEDHLLFTESDLDNREVALAFKPRREWPAHFKSYRLYSKAGKIED